MAVADSTDEDRHFTVVVDTRPVRASGAARHFAEPKDSGEGRRYKGAAALTVEDPGVLAAHVAAVASMVAVDTAAGIGNPGSLVPSSYVTAGSESCQPFFLEWQSPSGGRLKV
jgi:hypothetical protein